MGRGGKLGLHGAEYKRSVCVWVWKGPGVSMCGRGVDRVWRAGKGGVRANHGSRGMLVARGLARLKAATSSFSVELLGARVVEANGRRRREAKRHGPAEDDD